MNIFNKQLIISGISTLLLTGLFAFIAVTLYRDHKDLKDVVTFLNQQIQSSQAQAVKH